LLGGPTSRTSVSFQIMHTVYCIQNTIYCIEYTKCKLYTQNTHTVHSTQNTVCRVQYTKYSMFSIMQRELFQIMHTKSTWEFISVYILSYTVYTIQCIHCIRTVYTVHTSVYTLQVYISVYIYVTIFTKYGVISNHACSIQYTKYCTLHRVYKM
jgi:hypothetical protein